MSARMRHLKCPSSQYPVLKVHALRLIRSDRAARQGDILPDRRGPGGGNRALHICSQINRSLSRVTEVKTEALASDIGDDQLFYEY